ncbi:MAG TPA: hypothetical protein VGQ46_01705 [Thermoanaerobaculia bacterium]|nr:hypothetical protein [Thermoanaerobaculia bacterium]
MPQIIFLSLFLGLVTGVQNVSLRVDDGVKSVRIELGGREVARMQSAPWSARVDFGPALTPRELTAIAYDAEGKEITRIAQSINLARPAAELEIVIHREGKRPVEAELVGRHRLHKFASGAKLTIDGSPVRVGRDFRAQLPPLDAAHAHVVSAELEFDDGAVARRDVVLSAVAFSNSVETELTPVLVTSDGDRQLPSLDNCFSAGGSPLKATAVEKSDAHVVMVRDPATRVTPLPAAQSRLDADTAERILWPVSRPINSPGEPTAIAFPQSVNHGKTATVSWLLTQRLAPAPATNEPRQFADAVAVAALGAIEKGHRRAVVLLLSKAQDTSLYSPAVVRGYLDEIGVPLFVWSSDGPRSDQTATWGRIDDISTAAGMTTAVTRLNAALAAQRIVWVAAEPLTALRAEGSERCGLTPVAHQHAVKQ